MGRPKGSKNGAAARRQLSDYPLKVIHELEYQFDGAAVPLDELVEAIDRVRRMRHREADYEYTLELVRTYPNAFVTTTDQGVRYVCKNNKQYRVVHADAKAYRLYQRMLQLFKSGTYNNVDLEVEYAASWSHMLTRSEVGRFFAEYGVFQYSGTVMHRDKAKVPESGRRVLTGAYRRSDHGKRRRH